MANITSVYWGNIGSMVDGYGFKRIQVAKLPKHITIDILTREGGRVQLGPHLLLR